jgi:hypothetical protein
MTRLASLDAPGILRHVMGRGIERKENGETANMYYLFLVKIVIDAKKISDMSKKGWRWDDGRNLLAED